MRSSTDDRGTWFLTSVNFNPLGQGAQLLYQTYVPGFISSKHTVSNPNLLSVECHGLHYGVKWDVKGSCKLYQNAQHADP